MVDVTTASTAIDLRDGAYAQFLDCIQRNYPFRVQAEPVPVIWRTGRASGVVSANATVTPTGTANQQGGIVPANEDPLVLQHLDPAATHLIVVTATGSGHLRFTSGRA